MDHQPSHSPVDALLERRRNEDQLALDIIEECRVTLMLKFRFLDLALWRMELTPLRVDGRYALACDGKRVVFNPARVIARFSESFDEMVRDYLHMVLHCIFCQPFDKVHQNREAWELCCDILVESAALDICGNRFACEDDKARKDALDLVRMQAGNLVPHKVYSLIKGMVETPDGQQFRGLGRSTLNEWHKLFERDEHAAWPANNDDTRHDSSLTEVSGASSQDNLNESDGIRTEVAGEESEPESNEVPQSQQARLSEENGTDNEDESEGSENGTTIQADEQAAQTATLDESMPGEPGSSEQDSSERDWEDIAKQIEMDLETFSKEWGDEAGGLMALLKVTNRPTYSYSEFLRRFMAPTETMLINQDEFDYIYYTYGLELYGDMPLVEPLEYKETDKIRDFVIAIDTSESVSGDLVHRFLDHTFNILKKAEDFACDINVHVIQCDSKIQSDTLIKSLSDVDELLENFVVRGFGGTDFRPVFDYVNVLRKRGVLTDLKGLIYFTDGLGQFPEKAPDYDAAFVFIDTDGKPAPAVPPWAMKLVIDESELYQRA